MGVERKERRLQTAFAATCHNRRRARERGASAAMLSLLLVYESSCSFALTSRLGSHVPAGRQRARPLLSAPEPPEPEPQPTEEEPVDLRSEFDAGLAYGQQIKSRFTAPRIDDPGLPFADALVCVSGSLFIAQWALSPLVPNALKIPPPSWLTAMSLPGGIDWRGIPYILSTIEHGAALAACWILGALAASAYESEAFTGTWQTALTRTWKGGAFAIGVLIFSTQLSLYLSLSSQGLDPYTIPSQAGVDSNSAADRQILTTAFELFCDCSVQAVQLTLFRLYRWADAQGPGKGTNQR